MTINNVIYWFEKYSFIIILLYCCGFFFPNLSPKTSIMANDAIAIAEMTSSGNITKQLFWLSFFIFFTWRFFEHNIFTEDAWKMLGVLLFMTGGLALVSVLWSEYPQLTLKRSFFQIVFCFSIVSSFYYAKKHEVIEYSLNLGAMLIVGMILMSIILGVAFSSGGSLAAFTNSKNVLGQNLITVIALMFLQIKLFGQSFSKTKWLIAILCLFLLLTVSKTSIALLLIFILLGYSNLFLAKLLTSVFFVSACTIFIFTPVISYYLGEYIHIGLYLDSSAITGRGIIWDTLYEELIYFSKLLMGHGYGAYFGNGTVPYFFDNEWSFLKHIASSHNGYIDMLIQYGIALSLPIVFCLYALTSKIKHCWLSAAFIIPIVYNLTESTFLKDQSIIWFFTVVLFSYVVIMNHESLSSRQR
jgi:exopolysaccharide production protein ExoQ